MKTPPPRISPTHPAPPQPPLCWLCHAPGPDTIINVACDVPSGTPCPEHDVPVHFGCFLDMTP